MAAASAAPRTCLEAELLTDVQQRLALPARQIQGDKQSSPTCR